MLPLHPARSIAAGAFSQGVRYAQQSMGGNPMPMLFAVSFGASMCFASPFSTPPNALVMHAGNYTFTDYVKVGLPLQIIIGIVMILVLPLLFPF